MYIPTFKTFPLLLKMPTTKQLKQPIQHGAYAFYIDLKDAYSQISNC